ncbi:chromosome segregation protein Csm1/Pcs1-domain-containing protein [Limtongia smithiae]|uniref:chromosome segregation protein Csm1/Pcs1-domain-containing protein n=1 Tax=Limtongia smithiae TaxID=1125753 RepID=UPI0034CEBE83
MPPRKKPVTTTTTAAVPAIAAPAKKKAAKVVSSVQKKNAKYKHGATLSAMLSSSDNDDDDMATDDIDSDIASVASVQKPQHRTPLTSAPTKRLNTSISAVRVGGKAHQPQPSSIQRVTKAPSSALRHLAPTAKNIAQRAATVEIPETQGVYDIVEEEPDSAFPDPTSPSCPVSARESESHDALLQRYNTLAALRETGAEEALASYRSSAERRFTAADELIAALRGELAQRARRIKELDGVSARAKELESVISAREGTVQKLAQENQMLRTKFLAPSSTTSTVITATGAAGSTSLAKLKEDMLSDLTGLIVRDVRRESGNQVVFDCLQTGRNGAFHYKLLMPDVTAGNNHHHHNTSSSSAYDDEEVTLVPMLDEERDRALIRLLPEYLTESLTFKRSATAQCFLKISQALHKSP